MTSMIRAEEVFKLDARGRVRVSVERREALLEEFARSGGSAAAFARLAGVNYQTFATWLKKQRQSEAALSQRRTELLSDEAEAKSKPVRLFEAMVEGGGPNRGGREVGGLVVELPGGSRMEVESPSQAQMAAELVVLIAQRARSRC